MEKHLDYLERRRKKIFDHLVAIHQPERMSIQALDDVAEFIRNEYPVIKNLGVDLFSYDCPEKLYDEVSAKVRKYRRQQRVRRFMSNVYKEDKGLWSEEVAYWLDQLFQNNPSKKVVRELRERLAAIKCADDLVHTLKVTINNHFGTGDFPPIDGTTLQKVYQNDSWMLLEAWSASDIRSLTGDIWCIAGVGTFNDYTFEGFARSYVLYQKSPEGGMEIIAFHVKDVRGVASIDCAFDYGNDHCEGRLAQMLETAPAPLNDSLRGFTDEDIYQKPELWVANTDLARRNITLPSDVYQKLLSDWVNGLSAEWKELKDHYKGVVAKNLLFFAQQHRDIEGFLNIVMSAEESCALPDWNDRLAKWCLSDSNPPTVSAEVIKRFVEKTKDCHIHGVAMMDLLVVSSRIAPDVTREELLKLANARRNGFPSFLSVKEYREDALSLEGEKEGEKTSRPEWVESALSELLESACSYGAKYLLGVIKTESRWLGDELSNDARWNRQFLDVPIGLRDELVWRWGLSYDEIYRPLYKRLMMMPEGVRLFREVCRKAKIHDWLWRFAKDFDHSDIETLFSEPVLNPQSLNELIKSVPGLIRKSNYKYLRNVRVDTMLSLIFEQAGRSLSTPRESLLSALCVKFEKYGAMRQTLSVVIRDKSVRLDKGTGWEGRLNVMNRDPQLLKVLLTSDRLSLNKSDNQFLSSRQFLRALDECYYCGQIEKSELIDAYVDRFGASALQSLVDMVAGNPEYLSVLDDDVMRHIQKTTHVKERLTISMVRDRALKVANAGQALALLKKVQDGEGGHQRTIVMASHVHPSLLLDISREHISEVKHPQGMAAGVANSMKNVPTSRKDYPTLEEVMELIDRLSPVDSVIVDCIDTVKKDIETALKSKEQKPGRYRRVEDWLKSKKVAQIGGGRLLASVIMELRDSSDCFARWLLAQDSVRKAGFADVWPTLLNTEYGRVNWMEYESLMDEMIAIEKACSLSPDKENEDVKSQSKGADVVKEDQMEMDGF